MISNISELDIICRRIIFDFSKTTGVIRPDFEWRN